MIFALHNFHQICLRGVSCGLFLVSLALLVFVSCLTRGNPADSWVATDALGRELPTYADVGRLRESKKVGVFYYVWVGNHTRKVYDITKILEQPEGERSWGATGSFHFWGEPEYGYYHASDPWVIRHDMQMLTNAGVDFIFIDTTNALTYPETVRALFQVSAQMREEGIASPAICFITNNKSGETMNRLYDEVYGLDLYPELWFRWEGKPLIMGQADDPALRSEVRDFFTIKRSWAWTRSKEEPNHWQWLDTYPQDYGWIDSPKRPEQITVSTAQHPISSQGKSYHDGAQPPVDANYLTPQTDEGLQFEEQWSRAHEVDPDVVMVTQWNEWIAQRFLWGDERSAGTRKTTFAGLPVHEGDSYFVDVFTREFNRDIAPMKCGYSDNYYYQLVGHVRRLKGMDAPLPRAPMHTVTIDGDFSDWETVPIRYYDPPGDTAHRDFQGTDRKTRYVNETGRNDIVRGKVTHDKEKAYFYVRTQDALTAPQGDNWMLLLIDTDQSKSTGWEGYGLLVNRHRSQDGKSSVEVWRDGSWVSCEQGHLAYQGNELELSVPVTCFSGASNGFDFKWVDNPRDLEDISAFFLDGEAAPDRRFNFRY